MTKRLLPHQRQIRPRGEGTIAKQCEHCRSEFTARLADIDIGNGRFCSMKCAYAANKRPTAERFWSHVVKTETCWLFNGGKTKDYGVLNDGNGNNVRANRFSWELHNGPIPHGLWVLHKCDNPPCVNPDHLFLGDRSANMKDAAAKGRLDQQTNPLRRRAAMATLTLAEAATVKREYTAGGITLQALGDRYGVTKSAIWRIVRDLNWKDVGHEHQL